MTFRDNVESESVPTLSFLSLFAFATNVECFLNVVALIAALGTGTGQPLLSFYFGKLAQSFIDYGAAVKQQSMDPSSMAQQAVVEASKTFKHAAAKDSLILAIIGKFHFHS